VLIAAVGGDFLDYFELTAGSIGLYLGDVSGKGLPAAMYAALAVGTLRGVHKIGQPGLFFFVAHKKSASVKEHCELWSGRSGRIALTRRLTRPTLRSF
jgi:hypothetical protein